MRTTMDRFQQVPGTTTEYMLCAPSALGVHELRLFDVASGAAGQCGAFQRKDGSWSVYGVMSPSGMRLADVGTWGESAMRDALGDEAIIR